MSLTFVNKPSGISTHQVEKNKDPYFWGMAEYTAHHSNQPCFVIHRLDKGTSGALALAHTPELTAQATAAFENHQVTKEYVFITKNSPRPNARLAHIEVLSDGFVVRSYIEKKGSQFVSHLDRPENAETHIRLRESANGFHVYEAHPKTGKPHQIRLHAHALGLSILGDREHGGAEFPRLLLHAHQLQFHDPALGTFTAPLPLVMQHFDLLDDRELSAWVCGIEKRGLLYPSTNQTECRRILHTDGGDLRADRYGSVTFFYWFGDQPPQETTRTKIERLAELFQIRSWYLRWMKDRGSGVQALPLWKSHHDLPETWIAQENQIRYELRASGFSPGLFLDQRANRKWVQESAKDKRVLNLFCYTGGFSLAAAKGQAKTVTSVDLSQNFLRWLKRNIEINNLNPDQHEIWTLDSRLFLDGAHRKGREFDLIICDPPSFSRGPGGVFRIEKDTPQLLEKMARVLAPHGQILFSTNYEKWTREQFAQVVENAARKLKLKVEPPAYFEWDFEGPVAEPILKFAKLRR